MTDLVKRLREDPWRLLQREAAAEIELLRAENRDLRLELALLKTSLSSHKQGE